MWTEENKSEPANDDFEPVAGFPSTRIRVTHEQHKVAAVIESQAVVSKTKGLLFMLSLSAAGEGRETPIASYYVQPDELLTGIAAMAENWAALVDVAFRPSVRTVALAMQAWATNAQESGEGESTPTFWLTPDDPPPTT